VQPKTRPGVTAVASGNAAEALLRSRTAHSIETGRQMQRTEEGSSASYSDGGFRRLVLLVWTLLFAVVLTGCSCASEEPEKDGPRPIREVPAGAIFYLGDHQGSPVVVTNAKGEVIREKAYHPYGSTRHERGDPTDPYAYVGNEQDRGSGLSDFHARPYREQAAVFLAPDPVAVFHPESVLDEPQRLSAYGYCGGDAVNRSDPSGELWPAVLAGVAAAVAITVTAQYANAPTRTNPETKHKDAPEMGLEATATAISIYGAVRGAVALAEGGIALARAAAGRLAATRSAKLAGQKAAAPRSSEPAFVVTKQGSSRADELVEVSHYTDLAGVVAIERSGSLRMGTFVAAPGEVRGLSARQVESALEILPGRGSFHTTFSVPRKNLAIPYNGPVTSGGKSQYQLMEPTPIARGTFRQTTPTP
jgi:RHS repeat-associated protein